MLNLIKYVKSRLFDEKDTENKHFIDSSQNLHPRMEAIKISIFYLFIGWVWIFLSDKILSNIHDEYELLTQLQTYKGWFYVIITGISLYILIRKRMILYKNALKNVEKAYEQLSCAHEELTAIDETLREQYRQLEESELRYYLAVEGVNDGIWDWDIKENRIYFSSKWKSMLGYNENEILDSFEAWETLLHPEDRKEAVIKIKNYIGLGDGIYQNIYRLRSKNGNYRWILSKGKGIKDNKGNIIRVAGSHTDLTSQVQLQEQLRKEKEISERVLSTAHVFILVIENDGRLVRFNKYAEKVTGYSRNEVVGKEWMETIIPKEYHEYFISVINNLQDKPLLEQYESKILCKNGKEINVLWSSTVLFHKDESILGTVLIGTDISERKKMEQRLYDLAYYDSLTKLPNRRLFEEKAKELLIAQQRKNNKLVILYIDIDNFKYINDTLGHVSGDEFLTYFANILQQQVVSPNLIARLSGDEFVITIEDIQDMNDVEPIIYQLRKKLLKPWTIKGQEFYISVSIGCVIYPDHGEDLTTLLKNADTAMFQAKERGKDTYCLYNEQIQEKTLKYVEMANQLRYALEKEQFQLWYQPLIDFATEKIKGVEALVRWQNPTKGMVSPVEFIPFAEETGYIIQIDLWVMETAMDQMRKWEEKGYPSIQMSINVSSKTLLNNDFVSNVKSLLDKYALNPLSIQLEITETAVMADLNKATIVLQQLKKLGVIIALDDFGTGYSSLNYLQKLPIDILKMDRLFIRNILKEDEEELIVKYVIDLAHGLNMKVVAEGIETWEQQGFLKNNNCDYGQGYFFSKPIEEKNLVTHYLIGTK